MENNQGGRVQLILDGLEETGQPIPPELLSQPELSPFGVMIFEAYNELSTCRTKGENIDEIPWTAIKRYAEEWLDIYDKDEFFEFKYLIRSLDNTYLKHVTDSRKKQIDEMKRQNQNAKARRRR